ncbi:unnamed protein product [Malassezia sympodialis ATCC 42132]|uniref:uncharacterized protein n=1 Tax=Malassezia sympodialis (strain ATCC 42132) TaxID=1230383 RepID=UPI0002C2A095|nr:uncharacterized protein MSY001_0608 [Malassezia sympodialis ATCC 42132]CCU97902.1 unnamed protein product [Malassezia sympodialis ATCC 42132]|eukprot:XP_018739228.1 uncharacterized protein MSY001_0608 [Malassezia sympodialis ATCC 42132]
MYVCQLTQDDYALLPGPYINASLIPPLPSSDGGTGCIASQAPIPSTFATFFEHLVAQNSGVLVNLTPLVEHGISKSDQYWPLSTSEPFVVSNLWKVSLLSEKEGRDVFDAESTPLAHNVPSLRVRRLRIESLVLMGLVEGVLASQPRSESQGPVWVHCSAGLGRSGTLIGAYLLQQQSDSQLASQEALLMAVHVTAHMRKYRTGSVQTPGQLVILVHTTEKMQSMRQSIYC